MSYDTKCYELAEHFTEDVPLSARKETTEQLAQVIQDAIEDFLREL